jgi:coatomer protein complex subunit gamma
MVMYEAAKALCSLPVDARDLTQAIVVLQLFLGSPKPTLRFAAVRTLSQVALTQPMIVTRCNDDMEALISDSNRSIATLAITTLLKTGKLLNASRFVADEVDSNRIPLLPTPGAEASVDRLMKQISTFMGDIADEFKIVVVDAIKNLCIKYPQKHRVLLNFLANFLREEGGYEFKKTITDSILFLIDRIQECKETALLHLCEFIEDCEFTQLSTKILRVLGQKGPTTSAPSRYIRFIRNRVILENAPVRASAVSALAQFAIRVESLRPSVSSLLQSCKLDDDDEVRDRATMYLAILEGEETVSRALLVDEFPMSITALQKSIEQYQLRPTDGALTFDSLPHVEVVEEPSAVSRADEVDDVLPTAAAAATPQPQDVAKELYTVRLSSCCWVKVVSRSLTHRYTVSGLDPRVLGAWSAFPFFPTGGADGSRDGVRRQLHQARVPRTFGPPVQGAQHGQRPAAVERHGRIHHGAGRRVASALGRSAQGTCVRQDGLVLRLPQAHWRRHVPGCAARERGTWSRITVFELDRCTSALQCC